MPSRDSVKAQKKQQGLALLILIIVIMLAFASYALSGLSINQVKTDERMQTQAVLKKTKTALIAYAVSNWAVAGNYGDLGKLPCPDYNTALDEGKQDGNCGSAYANGIGYFPWRTVGIDDPTDASGTCLLYAVAPAYKMTPFAALNPDGYGQFQVVNENGNVLVGDTAESRPVAIIIAPGSTLSGQSRNVVANTACGKDYDNLAAYLDDNGTINNAAIDTSVENVIDQFVQVYAGSTSATNPINDRLITISHDEIWDELQNTLESPEFNDKINNLTEALALCLSAYATDNFNDSSVLKKSLPWPAAMDLNGNEYRNSYSYDDSPDDSNGYAGRLPYQVLNSNSRIGNSLTEPTPPYAGFLEYAFCNSITVTDGTVINLTDKTGEYWNLWSNWKDHYFYVVSKSFSPDDDGADCTAGCVSSGVSERAGIIFFSGLQQAGQQRFTSIFDSLLALDGDDDKDDVINYLEDNRASRFPDNSGNSVYDAVSPGSNDVMFCINTDMSVEAC